MGSKSVIGSQMPVPWKYGRFIDEPGLCLKSWKNLQTLDMTVQPRLPPTHLGTNPSMFPRRQRSGMSWADLMPSSQSFYTPLFFLFFKTHKHTVHTLNTVFAWSCALLMCSVKFLFFFFSSFFMGYIRDFWQLTSLCFASQEWQSSSVELECCPAPSAQSSNKPAATHQELASQEEVRSRKTCTATPKLAQCL